MQNVSEIEKPFEEREVERIKRELAAAKQRVSKLQEELNWMEENIHIRDDLKLKLPDAISKRMSKLEVHNSMDFNVRIEVELIGSPEIGSDYIEAFEEIMKSHGYPYCLRWEFSYHIREAFARLTLWF